MNIVSVSKPGEDDESNKQKPAAQKIQLESHDDVDFTSTRKSREQSKIWEHAKDTGTHYQCLYCPSKIKKCGNTSNMFKHLQLHPQLFKRKNADGDNSSTQNKKPKLSAVRNYF